MMKELETLKETSQAEKSELELSCKLELGQLETLFRLHHTDPWVNSDRYRTSRTISLQNTRTVGNHVHTSLKR